MRGPIESIPPKIHGHTEEDRVGGWWWVVKLEITKRTKVHTHIHNELFG